MPSRRPRRNKVLFGVLFILLVAGIGFNALRWRQERQRERERDARWQEMERVRLNGLPAVKNETANQASVAAPDAENREPADGDD
jgi:hypothetical protein